MLKRHLSNLAWYKMREDQSVVLLKNRPLAKRRSKIDQLEIPTT